MFSIPKDRQNWVFWTLALNTYNMLKLTTNSSHHFIWNVTLCSCLPYVVLIYYIITVAPHLHTNNCCNTPFLFPQPFRRKKLQIYNFLAKIFPHYNVSTLVIIKLYPFSTKTPTFCIYFVVITLLLLALCRTCWHFTFYGYLGSLSATGSRKMIYIMLNFHFSASTVTHCH